MRLFTLQTHRNNHWYSGDDTLCVPDGRMFSIWSKVRSLASKNYGSAIIIVFTILFITLLGCTYEVTATCKALFFIHNWFLILAQIFSSASFVTKILFSQRQKIIEEFIDWNSYFYFILTNNFQKEKSSK